MCPDPDQGWFVKRLKALVRLDTAEPELIEERLIVATRDGLSRISAQFTVPRLEDGRDGERRVAADAQHGVRITDAENGWGSGTSAGCSTSRGRWRAATPTPTPW